MARRAALTLDDLAATRSAPAAAVSKDASRDTPWADASA